ncbi:hypothetical protein CFHF_14155 [Caulobacter flavus]|uniref:Uncharacterized protein n=1 Tax=Caulobacter flavus TaxID=1679497 RepID=A0A2N5CS85_9CAUL|nr:hypothetical protein C1707_24095 [Caulobacter flavus]PLR13325.1 hypothetical protein CFHF_14155 [Caulobacter flavus]
MPRRTCPWPRPGRPRKCRRRRHAGWPRPTRCRTPASNPSRCRRRRTGPRPAWRSLPTTRRSKP